MVIRVETFYKLVEISACQRISLEREIHVGAQVVDPKLFGRWGLRGRLAIKEEDIGFDTLRIKDTCWRAQQGVNITLMQQFPSDHLASSTFKEHIVRDHDCSLASYFENILHVLYEIQLLGTCRCSEIFAGNILRLALDLAFIGHKGDTGLLPEGRIGEHHVNVFARVRSKAIGYMNGTAPEFCAILIGPNAVQI